MNQWFLYLILCSLLCSCHSDTSSQNTAEITGNEQIQEEQEEEQPTQEEQEEEQPTQEECVGLFGNPSQLTGLTPDQCQASCTCGDYRWIPTQITNMQITQWQAYIQDHPPTPLSTDPYTMLEHQQATPSDQVCALLQTSPQHYQTQTFAHQQDAQEAGALITHAGACGLCSSLQDLIIYSTYPDLTQPVRECGILGLQQDSEAQTDCLLALGFTPACASIWSYNITNTRTQCLSDCISLLNAPYHEASGQLNACIQCDEDLSGPVFKYWAGRTRRNSGLPTALCRPCDTVFQVEHKYSFD